MSKKYLIISIVTLIIIAGWVGLYYFLGVEEEVGMIPPPNPVAQNIETNTGGSEMVSGEMETRNLTWSAKIESIYDKNKSLLFSIWTEYSDRGAQSLFIMKDGTKKIIDNQGEWVISYKLSQSKDFVLYELWWIWGPNINIYNIKDWVKIYLWFSYTSWIDNSETMAFNCKEDGDWAWSVDIINLKNWTVKNIFYSDNDWEPSKNTKELNITHNLIVNCGELNSDNSFNFSLKDAKDWTITNYSYFFDNWRLSAEKSKGNWNQLVPTESNPITLWEGFLKTKLYVKNDLLYSFIVNDEEREVGNWNNDFRIIDKNWYFAMWWNLYFASTASLWSIWQTKTDSKIVTYECVNGLDMDWNFYVTGKKQEIKFNWAKKCIESEPINALYDDYGIFILEMSSSWELKYFPGLDGKSLKKISENEIWDDRWNILISECWHAGCEYTKKQ